MTNTTSSLENFDFLQLLHMLAQGGKTGVLIVHRDDINFRCWLAKGKVQHVEMGDLQGAEALARLMEDPQGRFQFEEGAQHPQPALDIRMDALALEALEKLPDLPLPFEGPARITSPERVDAMEWSLDEFKIIRQIEAQRPLKELASDPQAYQLISRLYRLGLLKARKSRAARLLITMTREVRGVVLVDQHIFQRWKDDFARPPQKLAVRDDHGRTYSFPLRSGPNVGTELHIPQELMMQSGLRVGMSVLVKPV